SKTIFNDTYRLRAEYLGKFNDVKLMPPTIAEIAFIGRSNSGKSSLLRAFLNSDKMPKVSSKPGSTRLIHLYRIGEEGVTLADFPGYGYAQSAKAYRARFIAMLNNYLKSPRAIKALCLLMDARRTLGEDEELLVQIAIERKIPIILCLNKSDQLNQKEVAQLKKKFAVTKPFFEVLLVSAEKRVNLDYLRSFILSLS
ncbi:MAG TPA: ribosome biogenesis GTP-binding protein YihA/YsxC, partial [Turneriella sp.]|nr:ribosome biogenesis GTP-binding protein YihA/YsxC [Turneriella sp.]